MGCQSKPISEAHRALIRLGSMKLSAGGANYRGYSLAAGASTNTTPEFWLNLQTLFDLETAKDALGDRLDQITPIP